MIDLTAPAIPPQNLFDFHVIDSRFHAAVELRSLGPLSDALLGQRRWDSPIVSSVARFLLAGGPEEEVAVNGWIREWRLQAVKNYDDAFEIFRQYEMDTFGDKSFFANLDSNGEKPEIDHGDAISIASGMPHHA